MRTPLMVLVSALFLGGCAGVLPGAKAPAPKPELMPQKADYFLMEPTHLTKGHIFMRRTPTEIEKALAAKKPIGPGVLGRVQVASAHNQLAPHEWGDIRTAPVLIHVENKPFEALVEDVVAALAQKIGPWRIQWKISRENRALLHERFSLNTETSFERFANSVAAFILNHRGLELNFELFDKERILVISDVFST